MAACSAWPLPADTAIGHMVPAPVAGAALGHAAGSGHPGGCLLVAAAALAWAPALRGARRRRPLIRTSIASSVLRGGGAPRAAAARLLRRAAAAAPETDVPPAAAEAATAPQPKRNLLGGPAVVVTGASQGVGRAVAERFARAGYHVVLAARTRETLGEAAESCRRAARPGRRTEVLAVECDITSESAVASLRDAVAARFGDLRAVICNAGVCMTGDFLSHSLEDFQAQLGVNFLGHVATAQAFLPSLEARAASGALTPKPTICFVNSFGARIPLPSMTAYCSAKYALQGFADSLRIEAAPLGVHVATVHPGVIRSTFRQRAQWRGSTGESRKGAMDSLLEGKTPGSQLLTQSVDEVADAVFDAVERQRGEVVVGAGMKAVLGGFSVAKALGIA